VDWLHARYGAAAKRRRHVTPQDLGVPRIGHFGFFRPDAEPLWSEAADWLTRSGGRSA
jgi:predicted alpha/beta hydrolase